MEKYIPDLGAIIEKIITQGPLFAFMLLALIAMAFAVKYLYDKLMEVLTKKGE